MMALEVSKYDVLYGRLLALGIAIDAAKDLSKTLYDIVESLGISIDDILKQVDKNGLRFDNTIYDQLNSVRTNSSQIGFLDENNIPPSILQQVV
jgi:5'(3')-deoxyribonucleotidase